jgi:hypothetical protein
MALSAALCIFIVIVPRSPTPIGFAGLRDLEFRAASCDHYAVRHKVSCTTRIGASAMGRCVSLSLLVVGVRGSFKGSWPAQAKDKTQDFPRLGRFA